ncbi:major capsid protein [Streptomyces sp. NPDC059460]|uniref:major capsid protein n=1 Tax=Streptomyces sp. NPDC059460 TaxID=3346840 RepID=UPI0036A0AB3C
MRIQWARGLSPAVPTDIGAATPATAWPDEIQFLIYPAGQLQIGRSEEVNLGVIHDSAKFSTNDYTALFAEECVALVDRSVDTRVVTVPICPPGETGGQTVVSCPIA